FKCDFAGDMLEKYPDLKLLDYGFVYKHGNTFAQDEITCFLMEKV
ncbi:MAG: spore coat polysaccharide biosynthesis protein SpsF, partial [Bermanella sp.]